MKRPVLLLSLFFAGLLLVGVWSGSAVRVVRASHNVFTGGTASAGHEYPDGISHAWRAIDGNVNTRWGTGGIAFGDQNYWWKVELASPAYITGVLVGTAANCGGNCPLDVTLSGSNDNSVWVTLGTWSGVCQVCTVTNGGTVGVGYSYYKITIRRAATDGYAVFVSEFQAPGDHASPTPTSTATNTPTNTPTSTPTNTPTNTPTSTPTNTPTATIDVAATETAQAVQTYVGVGGQPCGYGDYPPCHVYWLTPGPVVITGTVGVHWETPLPVIITNTVVVTGQIEITNFPTPLPSPTLYGASQVATAQVVMSDDPAGVGSSGTGVSGSFEQDGYTFIAYAESDFGCPIDIGVLNTRLCIRYREITGFNFGGAVFPASAAFSVALACIVLGFIFRR